MKKIMMIILMAGLIGYMSDGCKKEDNAPTYCWVCGTAVTSYDQYTSTGLGTTTYYHTYCDETEAQIQSEITPLYVSCPGGPDNNWIYSTSQTTCTKK
jgi:hypothetical protein